MIFITCGPCWPGSPFCPRSPGEPCTHLVRVYKNIKTTARQSLYKKDTCPTGGPMMERPLGPCGPGGPWGPGTPVSPTGPAGPWRLKVTREKRCGQKWDLYNLEAAEGLFEKWEENKMLHSSSIYDSHSYTKLQSTRTHPNRFIVMGGGPEGVWALRIALHQS